MKYLLVTLYVFAVSDLILSNILTTAFTVGLFTAGYLLAVFFIHLGVQCEVSIDRRQPKSHSFTASIGYGLR